MRDKKEEKRNEGRQEGELSSLLPTDLELLKQERERLIAKIFLRNSRASATTSNLANNKATHLHSIHTTKEEGVEEEGGGGTGEGGKGDGKEGESKEEEQIVQSITSDYLLLASEASFQTEDDTLASTYSSIPLTTDIGEDLKLHRRIAHLEHALKALTSKYEHLKHKYDTLMHQHKTVLQQMRLQQATYKTQITELATESENFKAQANSEREETNSLRAQVNTLQQLLIDEQEKLETATTKLRQDSKMLSFFSSLPLTDGSLSDTHTGPRVRVGTGDLRFKSKTSPHLHSIFTFSPNYTTDIGTGTGTGTGGTSFSTLRASSDTSKHLSRQFAGAIQYIQWLLHHYKCLNSTLRQKDLYIKKIENKLLALAKQNAHQAPT